MILILGFLADEMNQAAFNLVTVSNSKPIGGLDGLWMNVVPKNITVILRKRGGHVKF